MRETFIERPFDEPLAEALGKKPSAGLVIHWLGQAGFVVDIAGLRLVIDPYLSDSLALKYKGTPRPHIRMMPPPVEPGHVKNVDFVLCTHAHSDHMDPGTLPLLLESNPGALLIAPRAVQAQAAERSQAKPSRLMSLDAGEQLPLARGVTLTATRAAHETLERDGDGNHRFLGYCLKSPVGSVWHSGDCVPFAGQNTEIAELSPDVALLPVNGRRAELSDNGVPGNFSLDEAVDVARSVGAKSLIAHHYGLFDFNTIPPEEIDLRSQRESEIQLLRARGAIAFEWFTT